MLWPVAASGTVITSDFGMREHPIQGVVKTTYRNRYCRCSFR